MKPQKIYILLSLIFTSSLWAASFSHYDSHKQMMWFTDMGGDNVHSQQAVCIYEVRRVVGCGVVQALTQDTLAVRMSRLNYIPGQQASVKVIAQSRRLSSTEEVADSYNKIPQQTFAIDGGVTAGFNYYYPMLHLQVAAARQFSLGVEPMFASYSNSTSGVTAYGGYLTGTYYYTHAAFKGLMFQGGIGLFGIKATSGALSESHTPVAGKLTVGWRGKALWDLGLDIGVEAGVQYVSASTVYLDYSFHGLLPLFAAYIGYSF